MAYNNKKIEERLRLIEETKQKNRCCHEHNHNHNHNQFHYHRYTQSESHTHANILLKMSLNKTQSNEKALRHLKTVKPYDGWSLDFYTNSTGQEMVMLKRRNAPLYKKGFSCIAYDEGDSKRVIGITSMIGETAKTTFCRGVVLVEINGDVARDQKEVRVSLKNTSSSGNDDINMAKKEKELNEVKQARRQNVNNAREALRSRQNGSGSSGTAAGISTASPPSLPNLSDQQTSEMARLGMMVIGVLTILRIISSIFFTGYVLLLPLGIMYAMSNCPSEESFDAKKELKRVLRGYVYLFNLKQTKNKLNDLKMTFVVVVVVTQQ